MRRAHHGPARARQPVTPTSFAPVAVAVAAVTRSSIGGGSRSAGCRPGPRRPPRFVDETAAAGVDHTYDGDFPYFVGGGVAAFDCDGDGRPDLYVAGGASPAAPVPQRELGRRRAAVRAGRRSGDRSDRGHRRLPARRGWRRHGRPHGPAARRERRSSAASAAAASSGPTSAGGSTAATRWTTAFSATWEGAHALPTLAFGNYVADAATQDPRRPVRRQRALPAGRRRPTYAAPIRADAGLVHAVHAVQRLGSLRPPRPAGQQRSPLLQRPERRRGAALADRAGRAAAPVHGRRRLAAVRI